MAEEAAFLGRREDRWPAELARPPNVVDEGGGEQQVAAEAGVDLGQLAAEGRYADRVLEQAARVRVMAVRRRRVRPQRRVGKRSRDDPPQLLVVHLGDEELEEPLELVRVTPQPGRQSRRVDVLRRFERPHLDLELVAEALDAAEHADSVSRLESSIEELDVVPDPRSDPAARVDELECEIRRAVARPQPLLSRDRVNALHCAVFLEFRDRRHGRSFAWRGCGVPGLDGGCNAPEQTVRCPEPRHSLLARQLRRLLALGWRSWHGRADPGGSRSVRPLVARGPGRSAPRAARADVGGDRCGPVRPGARRRSSPPLQAGSKARSDLAVALGSARPAARLGRRDRNHWRAHRRSVAAGLSRVDQRVAGRRAHESTQR